MRHGGCAPRLPDRAAGPQVLGFRDHGPPRFCFNRGYNALAVNSIRRFVVTSRMIGKLKGVIDSYGEDFIVLDVHGVGYLVHCSARTLQELPGVGQPAALS